MTTRERVAAAALAAAGPAAAVWRFGAGEPLLVLASVVATWSMLVLAIAATGPPDERRRSLGAFAAAALWCVADVVAGAYVGYSHRVPLGLALLGAGRSTRWAMACFAAAWLVDAAAADPTVSVMIAAALTCSAAAARRPSATIFGVGYLIAAILAARGAPVTASYAAYAAAVATGCAGAALAIVRRPGTIEIALGDAAAGDLAPALGRLLGDDELEVVADAEPARGTLIEDRDGILGTIVHRPGLLDDPRLRAEVLAAAVLVRRQELLVGELRAVVAAGEAAALRLVVAGDEERRRLEERLERTAVPRLVAVRAALAAEGAVVTDVHARAAESVDAVRRFARGLSPVAADSLEDAVRGLAAGPSELALTFHGEMPRGPVARTAYFICAEAVTNAVRHAGGAGIELACSRTGDELRVRVSDQGPGGADPDGSGLRGLADRCRALGGRLAVTSSPGGGTTIEAVLPCA